MNLSREDANAALESVEQVDRQVREMLGYRAASPFLILWGVIWLVANAVSDLVPSISSRLWMVAASLGFAASLWLALRQMRCRAARMALTPASRALQRRRFLLLTVAVGGYFPAMLAVLGPLGARQSGAFISLFWAFAYMFAGVWLGMRMYVTGAITAAAIMVGYLFIHQHFAMWLAVVGGGSLLLAGFWLRRS
jgi:hypothetical protein